MTGLLCDQLAGLRFIVGQPIPQIPVKLEAWLTDHPRQDREGGMVLAQKWSRGPAGAQQPEVIYYQYRADRARRTLWGSMSRSAKPRLRSTGGLR